MNISLDLTCGVCHNSNYSRVWHRKITSLKPAWATQKASLKIKIQLSARNTTQWGEHLPGIYLIPITTKGMGRQRDKTDRGGRQCVCTHACGTKAAKRSWRMSGVHLRLLKQNLELGWLLASARTLPAPPPHSAVALDLLHTMPRFFF